LSATVYLLGRRQAGLLLAPVWLLMTLLLVIPSVYVFWLSLHQSSFGQNATWVGLSNYAAVLADAYFWRALRNTLIVTASVVIVETVLGLGMALFFAGGIPFKPVMLACILAPYAVSEVGAVVMWRFILDPDVGVVTRMLESVGLPPLEWGVKPSHGLTVVALISIWLHLPFTFIILYAARLAIPAELYEAASLDGATAWQKFRAVTLPLLAPAILVAMLFRTIFAFRIFSEVWLVTQGGPARTTEVAAIYLYLEAFRYNHFGIATATGWIMVMVSCLIALIYLRRLYRDMLSGHGAS
jgi:multiple sugar transport system permease protein